MKNRAIALNCIDGRAQLPVINWITSNYDVDFVDMITAPGMNKILSTDENNIDSILSNIHISINKNKSTRIFIVGHFDCQGNPVTVEEHKLQVSKAVERIKGLVSEMEIFGLWVNDQWNCELINR